MASLTRPLRHDSYATRINVTDTEFSAAEDESPDEIAENEQAKGRGDLVTAARWLADPMAMISPAEQEIDTSQAQFEVDEFDDDASRGVYSDFATLFPMCKCGDKSCVDCPDFHLAPRTAAALFIPGKMLADHAYDDVTEHGDYPVNPETGLWTLFDENPANYVTTELDLATPSGPLVRRPHRRA